MNEHANARLETAIRSVARRPVHEEVAKQLQSLMQQGVWEPGERLPPERELARRFSVSRSTVRQALFVLQTSGLVETRVGQGTFTRDDLAIANVTELTSALQATQSSLMEQLELRRLLEPKVASLAAERITAAELEELNNHLSEQERHVSESLFVKADSRFHLTIAHASGNTLLVRMIEGIHELLHESRRSSWQAAGGSRPLEEHRKIYEAIRNHDSQAAYTAMTDHILDVERLSLRSTPYYSAGIR